MKTKLHTVILSLSLLTIGCASNATPKYALQAETRDAGSLTLTTPIVKADANSIDVRGTVHHDDWSPIKRSGHVHVQLIDEAGHVIQSVNTSIVIPPGRSPNQTPSPRTARYAARLAKPNSATTQPNEWPAGAKVLVSVAFDSHSPSEFQE